MKQIFNRSILLFILASLIFFQLPAQDSQKPGSGSKSSNGSWKAGVARTVITPENNLWMAGFAAREKPAEGKLHDLWAKALAIEDAQGNRALIVTTDIIGYSRELSQAICSRLSKDLGLERKNIILNASHTHSCAEVNKNLFGIYPPFSDEMEKKILANIRVTEDKIVNCAKEAFSKLEPARISSGIGIARFAVNRRNNKADEVLNSSDLAGPSDYTVPVIKISDLKDDLKVLLFGYACHATTLMGYLYSGDYPGFAQIDLEKTFPGVTAMFYAGCGADQNGLPRGTIPLAEQYGRELSVSVQRALKEHMWELAPSLKTNYSEISLNFSKPLSIEGLNKIIETALPYQQRWATSLKNKIENGEKIPDTYPYYPVQTWRLGDQFLVALGGEVVVDYAIRLKKAWGPDLFIAGYSNDVMAYIPSVRVLNEGGYEGDYSMQAYGQPSTWMPEIEEKIIAEVGRQLELLKGLGAAK